MSPSLRTLSFAVAVALLAGCAQPAATPAPSASAGVAAEASVSTLLPALAQNVMLPAYQALDTRAGALDAAARALAAAPTAEHLEAARAAWREARTAWEQSESHLLGPVKEQEIDPALDSWPVNRTDLDKVLGSDVTLDQAFVAGQQPTLKGFHVIEYVIFANDAAALTPRKLAYLTALTGSFKADTAKLLAAWRPDGGNFVGQFGTGEAYGSTDAAFAETLGALAEICEEVADSKIETPLAAADANLEESQFSGATMTDFKNNMLGVKAIYLGGADGRAGLGLSHLVAAKNPAVDAKVRGLLDAAIADLEAVPGTFGTALTAHPDALRKAQASIRTLRAALTTDVSMTLTGKVVADAT